MPKRAVSKSNRVTNPSSLGVESLKDDTQCFWGNCSGKGCDSTEPMKLRNDLLAQINTQASNQFLPEERENNSTEKITVGLNFKAL